MARRGVDGEARAAGGRGELPFARAVRQVEAAGRADALVVPFRTRHHPRDQIADAVVVLGQPRPAYPARRKDFFRQPRDDGGLREELVARRLHAPSRHLHHAHRVLGGDELAAVALGAAEAGEDQRRFPRDEVRTVELGRDVRRERSLAQRGRRVLGVGSGGEEVSAQR